MVIVRRRLHQERSCILSLGESSCGVVDDEKMRVKDAEGGKQIRLALRWADWRVFKRGACGWTASRVRAAWSSGVDAVQGERRVVRAAALGQLSLLRDSVKNEYGQWQVPVVEWDVAGFRRYGSKRLQQMVIWARNLAGGRCAPFANAFWTREMTGISGVSGDIFCSR